MPFYSSLKSEREQDLRTVEGLLRLRKALDKAIPQRTLDQTLLLASWNLREFGNTKSGGREREPLFYIAEILSRFDLIAVQEVRDNLGALDGLMQILGGWWKYLVSDVTLGRQGNSERHAFIYDSRKLSFGGLAGELTPPLRKTEEGTLVSDFAFARSPYLVGFRAGWFRFTICTDHLFYGESKPDDPQRKEEARVLVQLLKERMQQRDRWARNAILLGDFNVFSTKDRTFLALKEGNFRIPRGLEGIYTNAKLDKPFDQMAFIAPDLRDQLEIAKAGTFPFFAHVYRDEDEAVYGAKDYQQWRTYKMSDHLPIWAELGVDFAQGYLEQKRGAGAGNALVAPNRKRPAPAQGRARKKA